MSNKIEINKSSATSLEKSKVANLTNITPTRPFAVADVGSTKTSIAILNMDENQSTICGYANNATEGMSKGKVTDSVELSKIIYKTLKQALNSKELDKEIPGIMSISGNHIKGINTIESILLNNAQGVITFEDINNGNANRYGYKNNPHSSRRTLNEYHINYILDGKHNVINPVGMHSQDIKIKKHVVSGDITEIEKLEKAAQNAQFSIENFVHSGTASSTATLSAENKKDNSIVIDIGGGTTDISIYESNSLVYSSVLPIGGFNFSNDISIAFGIDYEQAENIKINYGLTDIYKSSVIESTTLNFTDGTSIDVAILDICQIMKERAQEWASLILMNIESSGIKNLKNCILTGGSSRIDGLTTILAKTIQLKSSVCKPFNKDYLNNEYLMLEQSTLVGLIEYAFESKTKLLDIRSTRFDALSKMSKLPIVNKTSRRIKKIIKKPYLKSVRGK